MSADDLNDSLSNLFNGDTGPVRTYESVGRAPVAFVPDRVFIENCPACGGTGRWRNTFRPCFRCKSKGKLTFKSAPEVRAANRHQAAVKRIKTREENILDFEKDFPVEFAWCKYNPKFDFAVSMLEAIARYGSLTDGQMAAVRKCVARAESFKAQRAEANKTRVVVGIDVSKIEATFATAVANKIKSPKLRLGDFRFEMAKSYGRNPGGIYVTTKSNGENVYLGKVLNSQFMPSPACTAEHKEAIIRVASNPAEEAKAYGFRSGNCSCCGKTLTKGISIDMGIGPICAQKYGFFTY